MLIDWSDPNPIFFDFETQSAADLKEVGGRIYALHPSTRILSLTMRIDGVFYIWIPSYINAALLTVNELWLNSWGARPEIKLYNTKHLPLEMNRPDKLHIAHNNFHFDRFIFEKHLGFLPPMADSIPVARSQGLPGGLDALARFMGVGYKDDGKKLMRKLCICQPGQDGDWGYPVVLPGDLAVFTRYNVSDVDLMAKAWMKLEDAQINTDVIEMHYKVNDRGINVDPILLQRISLLGEESAAQAAKDVSEMTSGAINSTNIKSTQQVQAWLESKGVIIINKATGKKTLQKKEVEKAIALATQIDEDDALDYMDVDLQMSEKASSQFIPKIVVDVLQRRSQAIRITGAKADRALQRRSEDGRIYDLFTYHQAFTGRASSQGVQVHNLPGIKSSKKDKDYSIHKLIQFMVGSKTCDPYWSNDLKEMYARLKGFLPPDVNVDDALSSLIRPSIVASPGRTLLIADYANIEARVLPWLAGDEDKLDIFRKDGDPYKRMAALVYGIAYELVTKDQRQVGKIIELGCGYGMGHVKFALFAALANIDFDAIGLTPQQCVEAWRDAHPKIAGTYAGRAHGFTYRHGGLWKEYENAFKIAMDGGLMNAGRCVFYRDGARVKIRLPSGRELIYWNPRIEMRVPSYSTDGQLKPTIVYDSPRGPAQIYGGKITENIDQAISADFTMGGAVRFVGLGGDMIGHVHDEILGEEFDEKAEETLTTKLMPAMTDLYDWCQDFPLAVDAFLSKRYVKEPGKGEKKWKMQNRHLTESKA